VNKIEYLEHVPGHFKNVINSSLFQNVPILQFHENPPVTF